MPEQAYKQAIEEYRPQLQSMYQQAFAQYDVAALLMLTTARSAQSIATSDEMVSLNGAQAPTFLTYIRSTDPSSCAGMPSLTLSAGKDKSALPIGIMLDGPQNGDRT